MEGEVAFPYERRQPQFVRVGHDGLRQSDVHPLPRGRHREALAGSHERAVQEVALLRLFLAQTRRKVVHEQAGGDQADQEERTQEETTAPGDRATPLATERGCVSIHDRQDLSRLGHITREPATENTYAAFSSWRQPRAPR